MALGTALCHGAAMEPTNMRAGGCFLMAAILIGFAVGIATGDPLRGTVLGTAIGIAIAVATWLIDSRRRGG